MMEVFRLEMDQNTDEVKLIREYTYDQEWIDKQDEHNDYVMLDIISPISHKDIDYERRSR